MLAKYCINLVIISMLYVGFANNLNNFNTPKSETNEIIQTEEIPSGETTDWLNAVDNHNMSYLKRNIIKAGFAEKPFPMFMVLYDIETPPPVNV